MNKSEKKREWKERIIMKMKTKRKQEQEKKIKFRIKNSKRKRKVITCAKQVSKWSLSFRNDIPSAGIIGGFSPGIGALIRLGRRLKITTGESMYSLHSTTPSGLNEKKWYFNNPTKSINFWSNSSSNFRKESWVTISAWFVVADCSIQVLRWWALVVYSIHNFKYPDFT